MLPLVALLIGSATIARASDESKESQADGPIIVCVNPPHWLVYARYLGGVEESYEYRGDEEAERTELQTVAGDLGDALRQALR